MIRTKPVVSVLTRRRVTQIIGELLNGADITGRGYVDRYRRSEF
jgi:hypothetical protein